MKDKKRMKEYEKLGYEQIWDELDSRKDNSGIKKQMKDYEKLAKQYVGLNPIYEPTDERDSAAIMGYISGFLKAREMATEYLDRIIWLPSIKKDGEFIKKYISQLGEDEV